MTCVETRRFWNRMPSWLHCTSNLDQREKLGVSRCSAQNLGPDTPPDHTPQRKIRFDPISHSTSWNPWAWWKDIFRIPVWCCSTLKHVKIPLEHSATLGCQKITWCHMLTVDIEITYKLGKINMSKFPKPELKSSQVLGRSLHSRCWPRAWGERCSNDAINRRPKPDAKSCPGYGGSEMFGIWLVIFPYINWLSLGNFIVPSDELESFSEGLGFNHHPVYIMGWLPH